MSTITLKTTEVPSRWPDIWANLSIGNDEVVITEGQQIKAVMISQLRYRYFLELAKREAQRQRALTLPLVAQESASIWNAGFETLEHLSKKFDGLSDEKMDNLFGQVLVEVRRVT